MLATLHQRNFAFLWFGQVISLIGDWVLFVALPFYVYSLTGSTLATGIIFIVQTIPSILFGSVAGVFVDRWDRKRTMLIANLAQAITLVPLFIVHSQQWIWVVYIFAFIQVQNETLHLWANIGKVWHEWVEGLQLVRKQQLITGIFVVFGVAMVGEGIIVVIIAAYVKHVMHGNALELGWLMTAQAIGGIAGSLIIVQLSKVIHPTRLIPISALIFGPLILVIANFPVLPVVLPVITICGVAVIGFFVSMITLLQSNVSDEYRGRIFGALNTVQAIAMLFGMILASGLGDRIGIIPMLELDACFNILAGILAFFLLRNRNKTAPEPEIEVIAQRELLEPDSVPL